ncbi:MAG: tripartite tricarboxylate transporter substrate binding protein [Deltaproteobacteria bacterium]|nr:tripartite tricarboxylate transporter substrate binding protein [Deltaproteobacteria bacterium]
MKRILVFTALFTMVCVGFGATAALAQPFPSHPIQLLTPGTAGFMQDVSCRQFAEEVSKVLGKPLVVANKPGGSMTIAVDAVARAKKDGYTILYASGSPLVYVPNTKPQIVPYNTFKDLEPLGGWAIMAFTVAVKKDAPWNTFQELVEYAKKNPKKLRVGSTGALTTDNFNVEIVKAATGAEFTVVPLSMHPTVALLGGHVEVIFNPITETAKYAKGGQFRILLLSTKLPSFPNVPTLSSLGYKEDMITGWFAFFAPSGIPAGPKKILVSAIEKAFKNPQVKEKVEKLEFFVEYKSPEEFLKLLKAEYGRAGDIVKKMGLKTK